MKTHRIITLLVILPLLAGACRKKSDEERAKPSPPAEIDPTPYVSTDFSADGDVAVLQRATEGRGIDIVIMGDGYSDRMVADGRYEDMMQRAADAFFSEEPFASFRNLFNVYAVTAVSTNETVGDDARTALSTSFEESTTVIDGDDSACFRYAQRVPELSGNAERLNELVIIVVVNEIRWAGTCYPYGPYSLADGVTILEGDYGRGLSITYSAYIDADDLVYTVVHEAAGHGFAKLADEYYTDDTAADDDDKAYFQWMQTYGYWRNIDFSGDAAKCVWAPYLTDTRYLNTDTGYFEGANYCRYGVWRPSRESLMLYNTGGFNVISRETAYKRIHKLAYGDAWQFSREEFIEYDRRNISPATITARRSAIPAARRLPPPRMLDRTRLNMK